MSSSDSPAVRRWIPRSEPTCSFCGCDGRADPYGNPRVNANTFVVGGAAGAAMCASCVREAVSILTPTGAIGAVEALPEPPPSTSPTGPLARLPMVHVLKTDQTPFRAVVAGAKTAELRKHDRDFRVGDTLRLVERVTGSSLDVVIGHVLLGGAYGLEKGYVMLSLVPPNARWAADVAERLTRIVHEPGAVVLPARAWLTDIVVELKAFAKGARTPTPKGEASPSLRALAAQLTVLREHLTHTTSGRAILDEVIACLHAAGREGAS